VYGPQTTADVSLQVTTVAGGVVTKSFKPKFVNQSSSGETQQMMHIAPSLPSSSAGTLPVDMLGESTPPSPPVDPDAM